MFKPLSLRLRAFGTGAVPTTASEARLRHFLASAAAVLLGACAPEAPLPPSAASVDITMSEYRFVLKDGVRPGRVVFWARNTGRLSHQVTLLRLPEGAELKARPGPEAKAQAVITLAATRVAVPGDAISFAADLAPGNYGLLCSVRDPDGENHTLKGMVAQFKVQ